MKRLTMAIALAALVAPAASAQQPGIRARSADAELAAQAGVARVALETRVMRGKPYAAEAVTDFVQVLGDGNRIVRKTSARLFRDSEGRTRREELTESGTVHERNSVVITDPVGGSSYILHAGTRTATKAPGMFARMGASTVTLQRSGPEGGTATVDVVAMPTGEVRAIEAGGQKTVTARGTGAPTRFVLTPSEATAMKTPAREAQVEELGEQSFDGVTARGTRRTTVIPAGAIGNEGPITVVSEEWFSEDLGLLVMTRHNDPRVGETTYRLINISRAEPDRSLFQVPPDYTVK